MTLARTARTARMQSNSTRVKAVRLRNRWRILESELGGVGEQPEQAGIRVGADHEVRAPRVPLHAAVEHAFVGAGRQQGCVQVRRARAFPWSVRSVPPCSGDDTTRGFIVPIITASL